jgi:hypothetical protein
MSREDDGPQTFIDKVLGLKPGERVPLRRHGEDGTLYRPTVNLTADELMLWGQLGEAIENSHEPNTREVGLKHLERLATETIADPQQRQQMIRHVIAFADEMAAVFAAAEENCK